MSLSDESIRDQLHKHTHETVDLLEFGFQKKPNYSLDMDKIKFSLFHILDGYLYEKIGGYASMQKYITNNILYDNSIYYINEDNFHHSIYKLTHFLYYSNKTTAFVYFGTFGHASMLHIIKNNDSFDVTYINPGEGVIMNNVQNINGNTYCNVFNRMEVPNTHKLEFLYFIKVFLYFKHTPRITPSELATLDFFYCTEVTLKYLIPKLCYNDTLFIDIYDEPNITQLDHIKTITNNFYRNLANIDEIKYPIDEQHVGNPNIINNVPPLYYRLGDIIINRTNQTTNDIPFGDLYVLINGNEYKLDELYIQFEQNNIKLNDLYIYNPVFSHPTMEIKNKINNFKVVNFNTAMPHILFDQIKIDELNFTYYNDINDELIYVNINDLLVNCNKGSITNISITNKNLIYENFQPNYMKLNISDDFSIERMKMFFIDDKYDLIGWYYYMKDSLKNIDSNYKYLEAIFTKNKPQYGMKEKKLYDASVRFMEMYNLIYNDNYLSQNINNNKLIKYYKAALDIFNFNLDTTNKELLYKLFKSGSCVYMSFLGTIIYNYLQQDKPEKLLSTYKKLTESAYHILLQYFGPDINYQTYFSSINYKILSNKLNDLGIIDETSRVKMIDHLNDQAKHNKKYSNVKFFQDSQDQYIELHILPLDDLHSFISNIRNNDNSDKENIIQKYNSLMCEQKYPIFNIYEFIIIGFLWEYYFYKEKWDIFMKERFIKYNTKYSHISAALFTIAKCRIDVTHNECAWIEIILGAIINHRGIIQLEEFELFNGYIFIDKHDKFDLFGIMNTMQTHRDNNNDIIKLFNYITTNNFNVDKVLKINKPDKVLKNNKPELELTLADLQSEDEDIVYNSYDNYQMFNIFNITTYMINYYKNIYKENGNISIPHMNLLILHCTFITNHYSFFTQDELDYIVLNILKTFILLDNNAYICTNYLYNKTHKIFENQSIECHSVIQLLNVHNRKFYIINKNSSDYYICLNSNNNDNIERCDKNKPLLDTYFKYPFSVNYNSAAIQRTVIMNEGSELLTSFHNYFQKNELNNNNIDLFLGDFNSNIVTDIIISMNNDFIEYKYGDRIITSQYTEINYENDKIDTNVYPLTYYLKDRRNIIYETYEHIIHVLMRGNYMNGTDIMGKDKVIIIKKNKPSFESYSIKNPNLLIVDNVEYNIIHDVSLYPFLALMPCEALCLLNNTGENYNMIMLYHTLEIDDNLTKNFVYSKKERFMADSYYCEFNIKTNYLLPKYDKITFNILDTIYRNDKIHSIIPKFKPGIIENVDFNKLVLYKPIFFDSLYKIILKQITDATGLYEEIIQLKVNKNSKLDLLTWSKMVDIKDDNTCVTICENSPIILENIDKIRKILIKLNKYLCKKINFNNGTNLIEIIVNNLSILSLLMQVNIYKKNLFLLKNIIKNCDNLACYKIRQLNRAFSRKPVKLFDNIESYEGIIKFNNEVNITDILFEIIFSEIISSEQWELYKNMLNDYKTKTRRVYQLMMGKGKSSVITPLLFLNLSLISKKRVFVIVPEHLLNDTHNTFSEYLYLMYNIPIIMTDNNLKRNMLENEDYSNDVFLIDEFDSMYNPLQSNFNYVEMANVINPIILEKVFTMSYNYYINQTTFNNLRKYSLKYEIAEILLNNNYEKNITFGLSNESDYPFVIPYVRKDSPLEGSRFSMYLITLILTLKYMWDNESKKFKLSEKDVYFIFNNNKKLLRDLCRLSGIEYDDTYVDKILVPMILKENPDIPRAFLYEYYMFIFNVSGVFKISTIIKNISFIDVINMNCHWMIGYSGTVNISLDIPEDYPTLNKFKLDIKQDNDERINVYRALTNTPTIKYINGPDSLFDLCKDYDVLIDCAAILKNYENNHVAEILYNIKKTPVIYVTKNDIKMIFDGYNHRKYVESSVRDKVVYYYDQRHIVGTNFIQPIILNGLVTINKQSLRTNVAQAIYRMRKLNEGHTVTICYNDTDIKDSKGIYQMIKMNEDIFNKNVKPLLYLQYLKYFVRTKTRNHNEINLKPLYEYKIDNINNIFDEKINENLMAMTKFNQINFNRVELKVIISLFKKLKSLSVDEQINLLFGKSNTEMQQETQTQTQTQTQINVQTNKDANKDYDLDFEINTLAKLNYNVFNLTRGGLFDSLIHMEIDFSTNIKLLIPIHLMSILFHISSGLVLIPFYENNVLIGFILDCMINCDEYINIYPLYNTKGQLINPNARFIVSNSPLQYNFKTMFADNIHGKIPNNDNEYYINFHEIFNINPQIDQVQINDIYVDENKMLILVALYKLFSFAFKFTNNNPILLHTFSKSEQLTLNWTLNRFINKRSKDNLLGIAHIYADYIDILYKTQYLTTTLSGNNIDDSNITYPNYLLEITKFVERNDIVLSSHHYTNIERP